MMGNIGRYWVKVLITVLIYIGTFLQIPLWFSVLLRNSFSYLEKEDMIYFRNPKSTVFYLSDINGFD